MLTFIYVMRIIVISKRKKIIGPLGDFTKFKQQVACREVNTYSTLDVYNSIMQILLVPTGEQFEHYKLAGSSFMVTKEAFKR